MTVGHPPETERPSGRSFFAPRGWLRNPHVQSILASSGLRTALVRRRARPMLAAAREEIIEAGDGVRLHGEFSPRAGATRGLAILIHGWHGHSGSAYLVAAAGHLFDRGFDVFRLHLRDHGPSHHLNRELFNFVRLAEVVNAVADVARRHGAGRPVFLGGFSLGGNFALRVALQAPAHGIPLTRVVAVCPVLDPAHTMKVLGASPVYHGYFQRKWRRALLAKLRHFPEYGFADELRELKSLRAMNEFFVPRYTGFADTRSYLDAYALTGDRLAALTVPSHLLTSRDDPVIPAQDLARIARPPALTVELTEHGGHCGYLVNWRLDGWVEHRLEALFVP